MTPDDECRLLRFYTGEIMKLCARMQFPTKVKVRRQLEMGGAGWGCQAQLCGVPIAPHKGQGVRLRLNMCGELGAATQRVMAVHTCSTWSWAR